MSSLIHAIVRIDRQMQATTRIPRRAGAVATTVVLAALALGACERDEPDLSGPAIEESPAEVPGGADPAATAVIEEWSATLSSGDVAAAARLFALPSVAQNGALIEIRDAADARLFNSSLPCGARLVEATEDGDFVVATFELSERPGPGSCGSGSGGTARTAFKIEDGRIVEWRRVADDPGSGPVPGNPV